MERWWCRIVVIGLLPAVFAWPVHAETVYFLVAEPPESAVHSDSYVLPLSDPNDIAHARDLIALGPAAGQPIVVAQIGCGPDCVNYDYLSPGKRHWDWGVTEFLGFTDITIEILDGWPGLVQSDCDWWVGNTGGQIGFSAYTVVDELGTHPRHWERNFDGDEDVDFVDYALLGDIDESGTFDMTDLRIFAEAWLSPFAAAPVWFECWDWPYQCYGDADGQTETPQNEPVHVYSNDAYIVLAVYTSTCGWPCYYPTVGYNACADFDRDFDVDDDDFDILLEHFNEEVTVTCPGAPTCPPSP